MKKRLTYLKTQRLVKLSLTPLLTFTFLPAIPLHAGSFPLPVRGLYLASPKPDELPLAVRFIREALPKEGVNVLVMEFDYRYQYKSHPELTDADALSEEQVKQIVAACHDAGVRLIPLINKVRADATDALKSRTLGVLQTTWGGLGDFVQAYYGEASPSPGGVKSAECFKALFRQIRQEN